MTHYEVLGVSEHASSLQIKDAYRRLVKQYHPDRNPSSEAAELIKLINEAYDVLSDSQKRSAYDRRYQVYFEQVVQETPQEIYRREYIRQRREEQRREKEEERAWEAKRDHVRQKIYVAMWFVAMPIALFAFALLIDSFLPSKEYEETGWYKWGYSPDDSSDDGGYMQTNAFSLEVPKEVYNNYDFDHPVPIYISATPMFTKLKHVSLKIGYEQYSWDASSWFRTFIEILMLIFSVRIALERKYTQRNYKLGYYMAGLLFVSLMYLP
jgi:curved DNA-binding protein CbpA